MLADSAGAALIRVRIAQPACGKFFARPFADLRQVRLARLSGEPDLVGMLDQAAGLDQAGSGEPFQRHHQPRREAEAVGHRVRLGHEFWRAARRSPCRA